MSDFLVALSTNPLLLYTFYASAAASFVSGIIGSYVVVKRISFIGGSISHSVLGGIGLALWLNRVHDVEWLTPVHGALAAALFSALMMSWVRFRHQEREDSVITLLWTLGMALGIIFMSLTPGYVVELNNFLIGNILWVGQEDMAFLLSIDLLVLVTVVCLHKRFLLICFDEEQARLQGLRVGLLYFLLLSLTAVTIVLLIHIVGVILALAMLTIPAALANQWTTRLSLMMVVAIGFNILFSFGGIFMAYQWDLPTSATIALFAGLFYSATLLFKR